MPGFGSSVVTWDKSAYITTTQSKKGGFWKHLRCENGNRGLDNRVWVHIDPPDPPGNDYNLISEGDLPPRSQCLSIRKAYIKLILYLQSSLHIKPLTDLTLRSCISFSSPQRR